MHARPDFAILLLASLCALAPGCGSGGAPGADAATDVPGDLSPSDAPSDAVVSDASDAAAVDAPAPTTLRVQSAFDAPERAPDLRCLGQRGPLTAGQDGPTFPIEVRDFQLESVVPGQVLRAYFGDTALGACALPGCLEITADGQGRASLRGTPGAALRVETLAARRGENEALNPTHAVAFDVIPPADGGTLRVTSISESTRRYMPQSAGLAVDASTAQGMGVVRDCAGEPLKYATMRVFRADGSEVTLGASGPGVAYTNVVHRPEREQRTTNFNGQWLVVNLPPGATYRVEAWGTPEGERAPRRVACAVLPTWGESVTLRDPLPLRRPDPADPCAAGP